MKYKFEIMNELLEEETKCTSPEVQGTLLMSMRALSVIQEDNNEYSTRPSRFHADHRTPAFVNGFREADKENIANVQQLDRGLNSKKRKAGDTACV